MDALTVRQGNQVTPFEDDIREYESKSLSDNTKRAYGTANNHFATWCAQHDVSPLPATVDTMRAYLSHLAKNGYKTSTIDTYRAGIAYAHTHAEYEDPTSHPRVTRLMSGIRRVLAQDGRALPVKKEPVTVADLRALVAGIDTATVGGKRDRAIILLGFAGAFRRSELVAVDIEHIRLNGKLVVTLLTSKTDQEGQGQTKHILPLPGDSDLCPVAALTSYLDAAGIASGPVFRRVDRGGNVATTRLSAQSVALILKRHAKQAGLDWRSLSGHSLRAGFVTAAHIAKAPDADVMAQTGHTSGDSLRGYKRDAGEGAGRAMLAAFGVEEQVR